MWRITYTDGTVEKFEDLTLELLAAYVDEKKIVLKIENLDYTSDRLMNVPLNTKVRLIDAHHNSYVATVVNVNGELQRGELFEGDPEMFSRVPIVDWARL